MPNKGIHEEHLHFVRVNRWVIISGSFANILTVEREETFPAQRSMAVTVLVLKQAQTRKYTSIQMLHDRWNPLVKNNSISAAGLQDAKGRLAEVWNAFMMAQDNLEAVMCLDPNMDGKVTAGGLLMASPKKW